MKLVRWERGEVGFFLTHTRKGGAAADPKKKRTPDAQARHPARARSAHAHTRAPLAVSSSSGDDTGPRPRVTLLRERGASHSASSPLPCRIRRRAVPVHHLHHTHGLRGTAGPGAGGPGHPGERPAGPVQEAGGLPGAGALPVALVRHDRRPAAGGRLHLPAPVPARPDRARLQPGVQCPGPAAVRGVPPGHAGPVFARCEWRNGGNAPACFWCARRGHVCASARARV